MIFRKMKRKPPPVYDEDFFKDTRMSFGDHLEELRWRMWRAIKGLGVCLVLGFVLDSIGDALGLPWIGIGKPMIKIITDPVETKIKEFYHERNEKTLEKLSKARAEGATNDPILKTTRLPVRLRIPELERLGGQSEVDAEIEFTAAELDALAKEGAYNADTGKGNLTGLSIMEGFMVYIKVSLLCGFILACPWIFQQMWAFVAAGLYPHEKRLVHIYLPASVLLFIGGCLLCQFIVMPQAVQAMLAFYRWINIDPDLRLNEWLSFAIIMPLVFGLAFQTPIVMIFLNRIGMFDWQDYLSRWRYAVMVMAVLAAVLTPSTDIVSMLFLFVPTFGLYLAGVWICYILPPTGGWFGDVDDDEEIGV